MNPLIESNNQKLFPARRILDGGCGLGIEMFELHHLFSVSNILGADILPSAYLQNFSGSAVEEKHFEKYSIPVPYHPGQLSGKLNNQYELYCEFVLRELNSEPHQQKEFEEVFRFNYGTQLENFLQNCKEEFDGILLHSVLHWMDFEHASRVIALSRECLLPGGWISVEIHARKPTDLFKAPYHPFSRKEISELVQEFDEIDSSLSNQKYRFLGRSKNQSH